MTHEQIIDQFLEYADGRITAAARVQIERHLAECGTCTRVYATFQRATSPDMNLARRLAVDPFLPTRIRALAAEQKHAAHWMPALRVSAASLALAAAVTIGVVLGHDLSTPTTVVTSDQVITEFASSIGTSDIGEQWQSVMENGNGGRQ